MSFTDQKPFTVTQEQVHAKWGGNGLKCSLCGHQFVTNDIARWVYTNGSLKYHCGNFFTCELCDGDDVKERASEDFTEAIKLAKKWGLYGPDWQADMQKEYAKEYRDGVAYNIAIKEEELEELYRKY